jgi:flagellin
VPVSLNTNKLALLAQRGLGEASSAQSKAFERLASGLRINRASDDPAGLALSSELEAEAKVLLQGVRNINDGISLANVGLAAITSLKEIVYRLSELAEQAANGVYTTSQRSALNTEAQALVSEYNRITDSTEFNSISLFDPDTGEIVIQGGVGALAATSVNFSLPSVFVGDGTFGAGTSLGTLGFHNFGDFDGDGITDMLGVQITTIRFAKGNGDGSFAATTNLGVAGGAQSQDSRLADVDNDGDLDVISGDANGSVYTRLGDGSGGFSGAATSISTGFSNVDALQVLDINQDGNLDYVFQEASGGTGVGVLLGNGDGSFKAPQTQAIYVDTGLTVVDFNNDGDLDLATGKAVYLGNGDGTFGAATMSGTDFVLTAGDFNGDGYQDLVTYSTAVRIRLGYGDGTFAAGITIAGTTGLNGDLNFSSIDRALAADINRDGKDDLALDFGNVNEMRVYLAEGDGTFSIASTVATAGGSSLWRFEDVDQDGVADLDTILFGTGVGTRFLANSEESAHILGVDLSTQGSARTTMDLLSTQLDSLSTAESRVGAFLSRITIQQSFLNGMAEQYRAGAARITDVDVAEEVAKLVQAQIRAQVATSLLAQANQQAELVMKLIDFTPPAMK